MLEGMYDRELYQQILGIAAPWEVTGVEVDRAEMTVRIRVEWQPTQPLSCPECGERASQYDRRERSWHLPISDDAICELGIFGTCRF